jgi:hypothetical protein
MWPETSGLVGLFEAVNIPLNARWIAPSELLVALRLDGCFLLAELLLLLGLLVVLHGVEVFFFCHCVVMWRVLCGRRLSISLEV